jgi:hypothetical protein
MPGYLSGNVGEELAKVGARHRRRAAQRLAIPKGMVAGDGNSPGRGAVNRSFTLHSRLG